MSKDYQVTWSIFVPDCEGPREAAKVARTVQQNLDNTATCYTVYQIGESDPWHIDLAQPGPDQQRACFGAVLPYYGRRVVARQECCPRCGSEEIGGQSPDMGVEGASQEMTCFECNLQWVDHYALTTVSVINGD